MCMYVRCTSRSAYFNPCGCQTRIRTNYRIMHLSILGPTTPHTGHRWGLVGIIRDLHVNFDPRGGAFDQFVP